MLADIPQPGPEISVAVLGGGLMGHALAATFLAAGIKTAIVETAAPARATLASRVAHTLTAWRGSDEACTRLTVFQAPEDIPGETHCVVEAVTEDLPVKQDLFSRLEVIAPRAVLATNTSVYRVSDVTARMRQAQRAIGAHWWNPPHLMPIVEVVHGDKTAPEVVTWMSAFLRFCGKTPVGVRIDTPGFIGNRLQHALWREAFALVQEGVADAETVDLVARNTLGLKLSVLGPIENADYVGLDLTAAIHAYLLPALANSTGPSPLVTEAIGEGNLGAKSGQGLLPWPEGRREEVAQRLATNLLQQLNRKR